MRFIYHYLTRHAHERMNNVFRGLMTNLDASEEREEF